MPHSCFPTLKKAFLATTPVAAGYLILGIAFGIMLEGKGYGSVWALMMSTLIYAGSMQFAAIPLLAASASFASASILTLFVNLRHLFYGLAMLKTYKGTGKAKPYLIYSLTDETFALLSAPVPGGVSPHRYYVLVSLLDQSYWIIGSVAGALIGSALPFDSSGIDFAMTALFVVLFIEGWLTTRDHRSAIIGLGSTLLCLLAFGRKTFLLPSMVLIIGILTFSGMKGNNHDK